MNERTETEYENTADKVEAVSFPSPTHTALEREQRQWPHYALLRAKDHENSGIFLEENSPAKKG